MMSGATLVSNFPPLMGIPLTTTNVDPTLLIFMLSGEHYLSRLLQSHLCKYFTEDGRSMATLYYYYSVNHQSGIQRNTFLKL